MNAPVSITSSVPIPSGSLGAPDAALSGPVPADWRRDHAVAMAMLGLAAGYATLRYNVFKGVPWSDWPGYVLNKALAVGALWLLALAAWRKWQGAGRMRVLMAWAGVYALGHAVLSFALLSGAYFPKLISAGALTLTGSLSLLAGAAATVLLELGARLGAVWPPTTAQRAMVAILLLSATHTILPGFAGWFAPSAWPGLLPPLTLLAGIPPLLACLIRSRLG